MQHHGCAHRRYGITCDEYEGILERQGGACGVCRRTPQELGRFLSVDHDHSLGLWAVRGLVCDRCNTGALRMTDERRWPETDRVAGYKTNAWHLTSRPESAARGREPLAG